MEKAVKGGSAGDTMDTARGERGATWVRAWGRRYRTDKALRTRVGLFAGAAVNFLFVGFELYGGIRYHSAWFTALAVYYAVLTGVKLYIGLCMRRGNREKEWRQFRMVGAVMTILNLALTTMISIMIAEPEIALHDYDAVVAIAMATWTFYLFISAIVALVKMRGQEDAMLLAGRIVKFVAAVVSVLMLQTALIASFGTGSGDDVVGHVVQAVDGVDAAIGVPVRVDGLASETMRFLARMNRITGTCVGLLILGVTIYMIVRGTRENKRRVNTNKQK